ncbi:MAG: hypothetical protein ABL934_06675 [Lysobacteraceae bacterium]
MTPFFDWLQQATIIKRALDEYEKNPQRMLFAMVLALLCAAGAGGAAYKHAEPPPNPVDSVSVGPPVFDSNGMITALPQSADAERRLVETLRKNEADNESVLALLEQRQDDADVTQQEIDMVGRTGQVEE